MSNYNIQLQSNNTDLQTVLQTLQTKAAGGGVTLPTLTNEGSASDLLSGKQLIGQDGNIVIGTIATKTSSDLTASGPTVTFPAGYYASQITVIVPTTTQATPSISIDSAGKITATATQTAGYVSAGTKSGTKQLTTQAAKTITPSTSSQTAVAKDVYTTGVVTVGAIPSNYIVPSGTLNITTNGTHDVKNYASATVNVAGSGGSSEDTEILNSLLNGTISSYSNNTMSNVREGLFANCNLSQIDLPACKNIGNIAFSRCIHLSDINFPVCSSVGQSAFFYCTRLQTISLPECKVVGSYAFAQCSILQNLELPQCTTVFVSAFASCKSLTTIDLPNCTSIYNYAFNTCEKLVNVSLPACKSLLNSAFSNCYSLSTLSLPAMGEIRNTAFHKCYNLKSLYLMGSTLCKLSNSNAFSSTPIGGYSASAGTYGSIYVPASMLASYKAATNWTYFSSRFVGV